MEATGTGTSAIARSKRYVTGHMQLIVSIADVNYCVSVCKG